MLLRAGALRRLSLGLMSLGLMLTVTATVGTAGCVLVPVPEPLAVGPPVIVAPRPVIVAPPPRPFYRGGYYGHAPRGHRHHWR